MSRYCSRKRNWQNVALFFFVCCLAEADENEQFKVRLIHPCRITCMERFWEDLEITEDQRQLLHTIRESARDAAQERRDYLKTIEDRDIRSEMTESAMLTGLAESWLAMKRVLTDKQIQRVYELTARVRVERRGIAALTYSEDLPNIASLSISELERIRQTVNESESKLEKELMELEKDYRKQVAEVLQRHKAEVTERLGPNGQRLIDAMGAEVEPSSTLPPSLERRISRDNEQRPEE